MNIDNSSGSFFLSNGMFVRDSNIPYTARPIPEKWIEEIKHCHGLMEDGYHISKGMFAGMHLYWIKDLCAPSHWINWCNNNLWEIPIEKINGYISLYSHASCGKVLWNSSCRTLDDGLNLIKSHHMELAREGKKNTIDGTAKRRRCPDCNKANLLPRQRFCEVCKNRRRKDANSRNRRNQRKASASVRS